MMCVWYEKSSLLDWSIYLFICHVASELSARGAKWIPKFTHLNCIKAQQFTLRPKAGCGLVVMMTKPLEYWHEYVEDEYHNQHVADGGRRTWQHPPTKLMAPIQRVKPARLLMSPSNTNGKQTEIKEKEETTNKNQPEFSAIGQNPRPLKSERIKTCWYSPKIDVVNIQLFAAQIKGTCNLCLQTLVRRTRSLCSALKKYRKSVFNEWIKV